MPLDPALVHARALRGRGSTLPPGLRPSDEILESWARCLDHGLDYAARLRLPVVEAAELARRRDRLGFVRRLAQAELETLMQQIAGSNFLLAFADADGTVLDVLADNRFAMSSDDDIVAGSCWREEVAGTNGLGTALATGRCIAVTGADHYFMRLADISCTASPIRDADGRIVGLLDASSYVESRQRHTQALVQMSASHIENVLLTEQRAGQLLVAIHPRREFLRTLSAGLLAFDGDGALTALNTRAGLLLAGLDPRRGSHFEALFDARFDVFAACVQAQGEAPLTDRLGSALVARRVGQSAATISAPAGRKAETPAPARAAPTDVRTELVADDRGVAAALRAAVEALRHALPLVVQGETGAGKDRLIRAAMDAAGLGDSPDVIRCATLSAERLAAQMGSPKGSVRVLLLDELADLAPAAQSALLAWLDEDAGAEPGLRLVATTQHALGTAGTAPALRADLLYRLQAVGISVPPLRQRSDFAACARHLLAGIAPEAHLDTRAIERLQRHAWHGNWRELRAVLWRAWHDRTPSSPGAEAAVPFDAAHMDALLEAEAPTRHTSVLQRETSARVWREWERQGGSISATARRLGISRNTVYRHLREGRKLDSGDTRRDSSD
jgi:transcriptional regulator of acetoin/glycerol metabolism